MPKKNWIIFNRYFKKILIILIIFFISAIAPSCTREHQDNFLKNYPDKPSASNNSKVLNVAVLPWQSNEKQQNKFQPLSDYIQENINYFVEFKIAKNYQNAVDLLAEEKVDMAYLAALTYVKARERNPKLEPLVVPISQATGRPWYTSVIVVDVSQGIESLQDLKGKRFAFVSPSSTSGFLMPLNALQAEGINPSQDFSKIIYTDSHDKNETALANGEVDAIADDKASFQRVQESGKLPENNYKVIWESEPIPNGPIVINTSKFTPKQINQLQQALIDAPIGVVDVSGSQSAGYTLAKDADFDQIREIYNRLKSIKIPEK